jgi:hypothetical protein
VHVLGVDKVFQPLESPSCVKDKSQRTVLERPLKAWNPRAPLVVFRHNVRTEHPPRAV